MSKAIVQCAMTGVYIAPYSPQRETPFQTMDEEKAHRFDDTPEIRDWFSRNFDFEVRFVTVESDSTSTQGQKTNQ